MSNIDTSNWKEFKLETLFEKVPVEKINGKASDFPTEPTGEYSIPLRTAGIDNQGCTRYAKREQCPTILKDVLSVAANGNASVYYQDTEFAILQDAYALKLKSGTIESKEIGLFLAASINKILQGNFDWNNKPGWNNIKHLSILLPAITEDVPDWVYMEEHIGELEQERIGELDGYLKATGLNDYALTDEDKRVLSEVRTFGEFVIGNLFKPLKVGYIGKGKKIGSAKKESDIEYCIPLTCAKMGDNGIMYYGKKGDFITYKNAISIIADGAISAGMVYAQPEEAGAYSHSYFIKLKDREMTTHISLYLTEVLRKKLYPIYSREHAPRWDNRVENEIILLPLKPNTTNEIDYDYMEHYIKAMEKLVIADVVKYKDRVIEETKKIVNQ